jgi:uncharacterized ferritin-like protein (DUF455 family)
LPSRSRSAPRPQPLSLSLRVPVTSTQLGWDVIARFGRAHAPHLPRAFYDDFVTLADDEARHYSLLAARLDALGSHYGAYPGHDALWQSALDTAASLPARLAVEHATAEARGLDVLPSTIAKFERAGDAESVALIRDVIYPEEITHCAAGVRWLKHLHGVARAGGPSVDGAAWAADARAHAAPAPWFRALVGTHFGGSVRGPFNVAAREEAGFEADWYEPLAAEAAARRAERERERAGAAAV